MTLWSDRTAIAALVAACVGIVACAAPADLYSETAHMMRYGAEARTRDARAPGDAVMPAEARLPVLVSLMTKAQERPHRVVAAQGAFIVSAEPVDANATDPIAVDTEQLTEFIRKQYGVAVVDISVANGRYAGLRNELRVRLVASERTKEAALHEFMLICAGVYGMDPGRTVDAISASAVDRTLASWLDISTTMTAFDSYQRGDLDLAGWVQRLNMKQR